MIRHLFLILSLAFLQARADLLITEVNSNATGGDFFELHNTGTASFSLDGWRWTDDDATYATAKSFGAISIPPGGTIVVMTSNVSPYPIEQSFRDAWNGLGSGITVVRDTSFTSGLGSNDAIILFDPAGNVAQSLNYGSSSLTVTQGDSSTVSVPPFTRIDNTPSAGGHAGAAAGGGSKVSVVWSPDSGAASPRYTYASPGSLSAFAQAGDAASVGSPGTVGSGSVGNLPPAFSSPPVIYGVETFNLSYSQYRVTATDPNPGQTVTLSVVSMPDWVVFNPANGAVTGTPPTAGDFEMIVRATDNGSPALSTDQTIVLTIFPESAPVLLNEYSAVTSGNFLDGDDSTASDVFFGRVAGNGGEWFELVVVGNGTAGSTVDLRGWKVDVNGDLGTRTIVLSDDPYWSNVAAGTLLTFTSSNTSEGGLDTEIHKTSSLSSQGFLWSNIWIFDPAFVSQSESTFNNRLGISNSDTQFIIRDAAGNRIFGPAGEGIATGGEPPDLIGVNSGEVVKLETDPVPGVDPYYSPYNDGTTSSFGAPNLWSGGASSQDFSAYRTSNSPPRFTSQPVIRAYKTYSYTITTADPDGHSVTLGAPDLPSFLTLTPGASGTATLSTNRPLTPADAGFHTIRLIASDGQPENHDTPQVFTLTVFHDQPSVILNEYNAVSASNYLGDADATSVDTHFGRIPGNGGKWFELVVTGDGGPGAVDLRGWTIEIGSSRGGHPFAPANTLALTSSPSWSAVRAGTLLTFIAANSAGGGLDTQLNLRDRSATLGDSWSNIWMGDTSLVQITGATLEGNVVDGIAIDNDDTQFLIRDAAGHIVFGPVGEGIAPVSGISSTEVFELEGHPSPDVVPFITSDDSVSPPREGYDDGASGSTFGWPNEWHFGAGGELVLQSFLRYAGDAPPQSGFDLWIAGFPSLPDRSAGGDPDQDGRSNYEEYVFGGHPEIADGPHPQAVLSSAGGLVWEFAIRDDDGIGYHFARSTDLAVWEQADDLSVTFAPHPGLSGFLLGSVVLPAITPEGKEFFRIVLTIPED